jgi:hypothetical protein
MHLDLVVPSFPQKEIGYATLVRAYQGKFQLAVTNDGRVSLRELSVRAVLESYVGQEKAQLFQWSDTQVIKEVPPNGMVSLEFAFWPCFPGLVSVAFYVTDAANNTVMAKRKTDSSYAQAPVRWWFHVIDDISLETLRALRKLAVAGDEETKK